MRQVGENRYCAFGCHRLAPLPTTDRLVTSSSGGLHIYLWRLLSWRAIPGKDSATRPEVELLMARFAFGMALSGPTSNARVCAGKATVGQSCARVHRRVLAPRAYGEFDKLSVDEMSSWEDDGPPTPILDTINYPIHLKVRERLKFVM